MFLHFFYGLLMHTLSDICLLVTFLVPAATSVKGFDEDSVASLSTTQDETQDTHVDENGINTPSHPVQGGGYMLAASYWPKVCTCLKSSGFLGKNQHS